MNHADLVRGGQGRSDQSTKESGLWVGLSMLAVVVLIVVGYLLK